MGRGEQNACVWQCARDCLLTFRTSVSFLSSSLNGRGQSLENTSLQLPRQYCFHSILSIKSCLHKNYKAGEKRMWSLKVCAWWFWMVTRGFCISSQNSYFSAVSSRVWGCILLQFCEASSRFVKLCSLNQKLLISYFKSHLTHIYMGD